MWYRAGVATSLLPAPGFTKPKKKSDPWVQIGCQTSSHHILVLSRGTEEGEKKKRQGSGEAVGGGYQIKASEVDAGHCFFSLFKNFFIFVQWTLFLTSHW